MGTAPQRAVRIACTGVLMRPCDHGSQEAGLGRPVPGLPGGPGQQRARLRPGVHDLRGADGGVPQQRAARALAVRARHAGRLRRVLHHLRVHAAGGHHAAAAGARERGHKIIAWCQVISSVVHVSAQGPRALPDQRMPSARPSLWRSSSLYMQQCLTCSAFCTPCMHLLLWHACADVQVQGSPGYPVMYSGPLDCVRKIAATEGLRGFYRCAPACHGCAAGSQSMRCGPRGRLEGHNSS